MDIEGFKKFAEDRNLGKEITEASIKHLQDFNTFLQKMGKDIDNVSHEDLYDYSAHLISTGQNTPERYVSILRYGYFLKQNSLITAAMEVLDGSEVFENLSKRLAEEFGEDFRNEIFKEIKMPPLGLHPKKKPEYMKRIIPRLEEKLGPARCIEFLNHGLRDRYEESRKQDRKKFLESKNIDEFLRNKHKDFVSLLERHYRENSLFFTQKITKEVLDYVKSDPHISSGVREGDRIIVKKIPHMTSEYLNEEEPRKKRYFYCHCPWVKEALLKSDSPISPVFCNCSAGYFKVYWEIVFEQTVRVDVLESLLQGDSVCKFAIHLPKNILKNLE